MMNGKQRGSLKTLQAVDHRLMVQLSIAGDDRCGQVPDQQLVQSIIDARMIIAGLKELAIKQGL